MDSFKSGFQRWRAPFCSGSLTFLMLAGWAASGCGPSNSEPGNAINQPGTPDYIPPAKVQEFVVNGQIDLAALTVAVREYSQWKMRVPKDLNELVTSRYLTNLPAPPPGQKYAIDAALEVQLVDQ